MSTDLLVLGPEDLVSAAAHRMAGRRCGSCMVVDASGRTIGIFTERDLLSRVVGEGLDPNATRLREVMTPNPHSLSSDTEAGEAAEILDRLGFRHIPVHQGGRIAGLVSMRDLFAVRVRHLEALLEVEVRQLHDIRLLLDMGESDRNRTLAEVNERLRQLALTDALTGLYNHRYFQQRLQQELVRAARSKASLGLLLVDLDNFKHINDTRGHPAGDVVLRHIADVLRSEVEGTTLVARLRRSDIVARHGGDEFAVLLLEASLIGAANVAERLRVAIGATPAMIDGDQVTLTASIGAAAYPESGDDEDALVRAADTALYAAKWAGRDRAESAQRTSHGAG